MHLEQVLGADASQSEETLALFRRPLEIELTHCTINTEEPCPFIVPRDGVEALHEYAEWMLQVNAESEAVDGKARFVGDPVRRVVAFRRLIPMRSAHPGSQTW